MSKQDYIYMLLGPELGEKEAYIEKIKEDIARKSGKQPEIYKFFPYETDFVDIISLLRNGILFAEYKFIIINNIHDIKSEDVKRIIEYCKKPSPGAALILCSDRIKGINEALIKEISDKNKKIFWELLEDQKRGWIYNFFNNKGINIENDALDFLVEMIENNTKNLNTVCERLALFFKKGSLIKYVDIENFIYHSKEENVFTLNARIMERDFAAALEVLHKILLSREEDHTRLLSGILWQIRIMLSFIRHIESGYRIQEAFGKLKIIGKRRQRIILMGRENYSKNELQSIVMLTAQFDVLFRSVNSEMHMIMLQFFLYCIIVKGGKNVMVM